MRGKILGVFVFVGLLSPVMGSEGFVYSNGNYTTINDPLGTNTLAFGINNSGQVVGGYNVGQGSGNYQYGFVYSGGNYTTISVPGSTYTVAFGINDSGQIVGDYGINNVSYGFVYSNGTLTTLSNPAAPNDTFAFGINNAGQVVGYPPSDWFRGHPHPPRPPFGPVSSIRQLPFRMVSRFADRCLARVFR
jgi:probable HAF family extracellular repeat protein